MGLGKKLKKIVGKKAVSGADNLFGPKSWKTGAMIAGGALAAKGFGAASAAGGSSGGSGSFLSNWGPSLLGAAGDIYSARQMSQGQEDANNANITNAREQMAFQERMSNTAHQREVADLRAAGLNPVLSANSGASTPVGASAETSNAAPDYSGVISSAVQMRRFQQELKESESRIANQTANTNKTVGETQISSPYAAIGSRITKGINEFFNSAKEAMRAKPKFNHEPKYNKGPFYKWTVGEKGSKADREFERRINRR